MTTTINTSNTETGRPRRSEEPEHSGGALGTFGALMARDLFVTIRELPSFLVQVVVQPFFTLFVFGTVLGGLGLVSPDLLRILLPGVVGMTVFITALQNTALPLVLDFAATREIDDRLFAPISTSAVAVEKVVFGALRGLIAGVLMVPVGVLLLGGVHWSLSAVPGFLGIGMLGALVGGALGLVIGTSVPWRHINIVFAAIVTPLMFTGAAQFPFFGLASMRWFQVISALNPLTYVTEAMRWLLVPDVQSIPIWIDVLILVLAIVVFLLIGTAGFRRRAQE
jgi:ABC-2 type transport system permease protein